MNWLVKLFKKSKMGVRGSLIYLWVLLSLGVFDFLIHHSYPPNISSTVPIVVPINKIIANIWWTFASIHFGLFFEIGILAVFYLPFLSVSFSRDIRFAKIRLVKSSAQIFVIWLFWMGKMLLIGTFIEQSVVWALTGLFVYKGLVPISEFELGHKYNLWTSGNLKIHPAIEGLIVFEVLFVLTLIFLIYFEKHLRKKWKFYK